MTIIKWLKRWFCNHEDRVVQIEDDYVKAVNDGDLMIVVIGSEICKECNKKIRDIFGYDLMRKKQSQEPSDE